ncbi:CubicO group peptidase (beta-lactamase class C family) [Idiomarina fontislapidosi]|uniref:Serine hydrolase n=1 Tax=Idiomarina fontislapidosi TaxID=263723 RepID=A0A432Y9S8_9GAMM|nr:serine hydrolase domain-containing protein [Idiomarina fontislapidosi]PYE34297.1 CubicO group peptidase (beta-lactamase class C family) [Idiomarina fontislapidosi]RUO57739.1 serine hydrolase [Idiomarina fontislapidosi]
MNKNLTSLIRALLLIGTVVSLFFVPWPIVTTWLTPLPDTVQQQIEEATRSHFDGMLVYVQQGEHEAQIYTSGWHDRDNKVPARPDALFKIASISKLYIALATTKLVSDGHVSLDDTLDKLLPRLTHQIDYADKITLKMLVQHRSGLPNYTDTPDYWMEPPASMEEKLSLILDKPADFEPGTDYAYCNTNYLLLAEIINTTLGHSYQGFIKERILQPLNLDQTYFSLTEVDMNHLMGGYYVGVQSDIKGNNYGSMIASISDVGRFIRALNDGAAFAPGEQAIYSSIYEFEHGGLIPGYQSLAEYHPDIDTVVVQFVNTTDFNGYEWNLSEVYINRIVDILKKKP